MLSHLRLQTENVFFPQNFAGTRGFGMRSARTAWYWVKVAQWKSVLTDTDGSWNVAVAVGE